MSNKTIQCNLTEGQFRTILLATEVIGILVAVISGLLLVSLLFIFKKKAIENPVKRLNLAYAISTALSSLTLALAAFSTPPPTGWCITLGFFKTYWDNSILLYFNALLLALLLQVSSPIIPEKWKLARAYMPKANYMEGAIHIFIPILTLLINIPINLRIINHCKYSLCGKVPIFYEVIGGILLALAILILFITIVIFGSFFFKFYQTHVITITTKWAMIRLSVVVIIVIIFLIYNIVRPRIQKELTYHNVIVVVVEVVILLLFVMLIYLPSTQWCKCYQKTSDQLPLLPNTDIQHTNPPSEWDHSNVPSNTVSVHPNEMSDCATDHVSSLTVPGPKYGSTTINT